MGTKVKGLLIERLSRTSLPTNVPQNKTRKILFFLKFVF